MSDTNHIPHNLADAIARGLKDVRIWRDMNCPASEEQANDDLNKLLDQVKR